MIDLNNPQQCLTFCKSKFQYSSDPDIGASCIKHTYLSGESPDLLEQYIILGTKEFQVIIMKAEAGDAPAKSSRSDRGGPTFSLPNY
jgi:hypothetical protein